MIGLTEDEVLYNPAYGCAAVTAAVQSYNQGANAAMPLPLAFLVLPMVAQEHVRDRLPLTTATSMAAWIQANPEARLRFHERALAFKPVTAAAIRFGIMQRWLSGDTDGALMSQRSSAQMDISIRKAEDDARKTFQRARLVGKWFAYSGTPAAILALWGVRP